MEDMIYREEIKKPFTQVPNWVIDTEGLRPLERVALLYLFSKVDTWQTNIERVAYDLEVGESTLRRAFNSLIHKGILSRKKERDDDGRLTGRMNYTIHKQVTKKRSPSKKVSKEPVKKNAVKMNAGKMNAVIMTGLCNTDPNNTDNSNTERARGDKKNKASLSLDSVIEDKSHSLSGIPSESLASESLASDDSEKLTEGLPFKMNGWESLFKEAFEYYGRELGDTGSYQTELKNFKKYDNHKVVALTLLDAMENYKRHIDDKRAKSSDNFTQNAKDLKNYIRDRYWEAVFNEPRQNNKAANDELLRDMHANIEEAHSRSTIGSDALLMDLRKAYKGAGNPSKEQIITVGAFAINQDSKATLEELLIRWEYWSNRVTNANTIELERQAV